MHSGVRLCCLNSDQMVTQALGWSDDTAQDMGQSAACFLQLSNELEESNRSVNGETESPV